MDITTARRLSSRLRRSQSDDFISMLVTAETDPEAARSLWRLVLSDNIKDDRLRTALEWVLESVLVDYVTNHMNSNDEFAVVIGRRITTLLEAIGQPQAVIGESDNEHRAKTA